MKTQQLCTLLARTADVGCVSSRLLPAGRIKSFNVSPLIVLYDAIMYQSMPCW
jgi:hypothetical protein